MAKLTLTLNGQLTTVEVLENEYLAEVLRYRLGSHGYRHPVILGDAQRAIRLVRANAEQWKLDPRRIAILGFSAGGHLASSAATHSDSGKADSDDPIERASNRPDLQILIYPVISMGEHGHAGSRRNLLGESPSQELIDLMSNEKQVTKETPPAFIVHSTADKGVVVQNSDEYAMALARENVTFLYLRGEYGGHGFGLKPFWTEPCMGWLKGIGWAK